MGQFDKFGRVFQIFVQADASARVSPEALGRLMVRNISGGNMVPLGTIAEISTVAGPSLISLYNLYPAATIIANVANGYSSGQGISLLGDIADNTLPLPGTGFDWSDMSYQEKQVGNQVLTGSMG